MLAERFEVTKRTIERDVLALQEAGVPIYAESGRTGGYVLDSARTLPPVNFTPAEAAAIAVALNARGATPFTASARAALTKVLAAMSEADAAAARELGGRILVFSRDDEPGRTLTVPHVIEQAIVERRVLRIAYRDKTGAGTAREIEPLAVVGVAPNWYLSAWCRLREAVRAFRLDRITEATLTREVAPERNLPPMEIPDLEGRPAIAE
jgi:predicted DNA-binding transcriptional regulator YafY